MTSELETCRSQLHVKEREFDQAKADLEKVKQELQVSKERDETLEKEIEELKSLSEKQKVSVNVCIDDRD